MKLPFRVFSNQHLGTQYAYTSFTDEWLPSQGTGQSPVLPEINLATGNLILKSPQIKTQEQIGSWAFGFVYNAQNATPWNLNIPGIVSTTSSQLIFRESDGSEVAYIFDAIQHVYISPPGGDEKTQITKLSDGSFVKLNSKTGKRTLFDLNGNITAEYDARGLSMQYHYENDVLTSIQSAAGIYVIEKLNDDVSLYFTKSGESTRELLGAWSFDDKQRLKNVVIKDYNVSYQYRGDSNQLIRVDQTDCTSISFAYNADNLAKLNLVKIGSTGSQYDFNYQGDITTITDTLGFVTTATLDEQDRILSWEQAIGDTPSASKKITTSCNYNSNGDLKNIIKPNNAATNFTFNAQGLITRRIEANGQTTEFD